MIRARLSIIVITSLTAIIAARQEPSQPPSSESPSTSCRSMRSSPIARGTSFPI